MPSLRGAGVRVQAEAPVVVFEMKPDQVENQFSSQWFDHDGPILERIDVPVSVEMLLSAAVACIDSHVAQGTLTAEQKSSIRYTFRCLRQSIEKMDEAD